MKSQPHARLLCLLAFALLCTSACTPAPRLASTSGLYAGDQVVHVRLLRAERHARFEQALAYSSRMLLPQFVLCDDAPDDEDVTEPRQPQLQFCPVRALPGLLSFEGSPRRPQLDQPERPPRA